jgi:hypothetical protein
MLAAFCDDLLFTYIHDAAASYNLCITHARTDLPLVFVTTLCPCVWGLSWICILIQHSVALCGCLPACCCCRDPVKQVCFWSLMMTEAAARQLSVSFTLQSVRSCIMYSSLSGRAMQLHKPTGSHWFTSVWSDNVSLGCLCTQLAGMLFIFPALPCKPMGCRDLLFLKSWFRFYFGVSYYEDAQTAWCIVDTGPELGFMPRFVAITF